MALEPKFLILVQIFIRQSFLSVSLSALSALYLWLHIHFFLISCCLQLLHLIRFCPNYQQPAVLCTKCCSSPLILLTIHPAKKLTKSKCISCSIFFIPFSENCDNGNMLIPYVSNSETCIKTNHM